MEEIKSQRDHRRAFNAIDQHGREWLYEVELKTMEQTAEMRPAGWTDPLRTPIKYVQLLKQKNGQPIFDKVTILWKDWIADTRRAVQGWLLNLHSVGQELSSGLLTTAQLESDPRIAREAGPKPWPSAEAIEAASRGHQGLLGIVPTHTTDGSRPNSDPLAVEARKLLGIVYLEDLGAEAATEPQKDAPPASESIPTGSYQEFIRDCLKRGKSMAEGAELWREHQRNLKEAPNASAGG